MSTSVADIFEDYVESLQNLPSEIDQNMHELRSMDEEFQRFREIYTKHRRSYSKLCRIANNNNGSPATPTPSVDLAAARLQLEKDYKLAVQKQDQKIDLTKKMYDLVSRHIERIDSQMAKSEFGDVDWMGGSTSMSHLSDDTSWKFDSNSNRKTTLPSASHSVRKSRILHSSRPNPAIEQNGILPELDIDPNEPKYCYCNQVSYGDMVACDGENCEKEWFHYPCAGLSEPPIGKWYCDDCASEEGYRKKIKTVY